MRRHGCPLVDLNMVNILPDSGADPNQTWSRYHLPAGRSVWTMFLSQLVQAIEGNNGNPLKEPTNNTWYLVHLAMIRAGVRRDCVEVPVVLESEPVSDVSKVCQYKFGAQRAALLDAEKQILVKCSLGMNYL